MTIQEFEKELRELCAKNAWMIILEFNGIWGVQIFDKNNGRFLHETGATSLTALLVMLKLPMEQWV